MPEIPVNQHDLQGNVLAGYGHGHGLFMVLRVTDPATGRAWVGAHADRVTTAVSYGSSSDSGAPDTTLNLAFTHDGLRALGMPDELLRSFPDEFRHGMAARASMIGDMGPDAPARWEPGLRGGEPHVLVTVFAKEQHQLDELRSELKAAIAATDRRIHVVHEQPTSVLKDGEGAVVAREHFGFADGLAQPSIAGVAAHDPKLSVGPASRAGQGTPTRRGWSDLAPGEFVLGYPSEAGVLADKPDDPMRQSGSYMVVRKLQQDVALFTRFLLDAADHDPAAAELLAAKIVGRWRDGTPLVLSPHPPDPPVPATEEPPNEFRYGDDPDGLLCPVGAHVRRSNPRDALGFGGKLTARHRIIRRGMPYGPPIENPAVDDGLERGLMFVCYQANIARQFEVVQGRWLADGDAFGLGHDKDFLIGGEDPHGKMTIPGTRPRFLGPQRSFVINRGGGYFFVPGIDALRALAGGLQ